MYQFINSSFDAHLGCFNLLVIVNSAASSLFGYSHLVGVKLYLTVVLICTLIVTVKLNILSWVYWPFGFLFLVIYLNILSLLFYWIVCFFPFDSGNFLGY